MTDQTREVPVFRDKATYLSTECPGIEMEALQAVKLSDSACKDLVNLHRALVYKKAMLSPDSTETGMTRYIQEEAYTQGQIVLVELLLEHSYKVAG